MQPMGEVCENPGERLYRKGMAMNQEKEKLIATVRQELAEREIRDHCTFRPKLVSKDFYAAKGGYSRFLELKRQMEESSNGGTGEQYRNTANFSGILALMDQNQAMMPAGDDDDIIEDIDDEFVQVNESHGCCTGEVPME